ncbi:CorA family divalent cation transporter [Ruminococcus sp.]|uniref:magnesium transporter CorA family protein n=1 Tax=Ruminococcus sp. TaxID=41978 RepID=UPI0025D7C500|nr:CorA family divalent cation transporter [Ruminococcus sp.]MBQ8967117.1 magnesium transporter CorA [Ruminococcus sp.]
MYYRIGETLEVCEKRPAADYVAVLTWAQWQAESASFDMGIELEVSAAEANSTKAEVNYDSLTGTFSIPDRNDISGEDARFAFALDEKGIVFIDDSGTVQKLISGIAANKRWKMPCLERFLYDFLEQIVHRDQQVMERYEAELDDIEHSIMTDMKDTYPRRINEIRSDLRDLRIHYEQLMDLGQELEENENNFFKQDNLRYFRLFNQRMELLHDIAASLRDYTIQVRDLYQSQLDVRQNHIMTVLTIVTTVFTPLTLITGWYGMNFVHMPELAWKASYPIVILLSIAIVAGCLWFFKKKKWL